MATQNNEDSFHVDHPDTDQEGRILETHAITTTVHEMKVKGFHLVEGKQETLAGLDLVDPKASDSTPKMTMIHYRSIISTDDPLIDDRCYMVQENITEGEVIRTEILDQDETAMTPEELKKFEEDWSKLWKPRAKLY